MKTHQLLTRILAPIVALVVACTSSSSENTGSSQQALTCGLVAAYSFDQTSGTVLNDVSGNGNNGTITAATWSTTSKSGHSLSFNGTTAVVTVPSSASLNGMTQMTVESWVRPTSLGTKWRTVLMKESSPADLTFGLYANENIHESVPLPGFWLRTGSAQATPLQGSASLATNAWSHLAASYDGSTVSFYLNGSLVATRPQTGSIATSSGNLKIGASTMWADTEAFTGQIDTTCVWGTARTVSQIQSDMLTADCGASLNTSCGGSGGSGGTGGSAGASGSSGSGGTAGSSGSGGSSSGTAGAGGSSAGSGGASGSSGSSGTGGSAGTSGSGGSGGGSVTYSTNFDLTESPISESGAWHHDGLDWFKVNTANGVAFGTQTTTNQFDDSYAYLSGFPADQTVSEVIHIASGATSEHWHEWEILLRWSDSAHNAHGYECNLSAIGWYAEIVRWNGAVGDFTYLSQGNPPPNGVHDGDVFTAKIAGNTITTYLNGVQLATVTDNTFTDGNPGMGFYRASPEFAFDGDHSLTSFTASSIP